MERAVFSFNVFRFGLFEADVARNTLTRSGARVKIQDQPFRVLILLLEHAGEVVTREELRRTLWPQGTYVDFDGSLNVILKKLRAAIDDDSENPRFIETVPKRGYRFIAPVSGNGIGPELAGPSQLSTQGLAGHVQDAVLPASLAAKQQPRRRALIYLAAAVVVIAGAWFVSYGKASLVSRALHLSSQKTAAIPLRKSVAVLGFHNISGEAADAWLATALSEMLSTELAVGEKLRLVSAQDVANLRLSTPWSQTDTLDQETTARIGAALNGDLLVLGSYTAIGRPDRGQLRLDVRLQDAKSGEILTEIAEIGGRQDLFQLVSRVGGKLRDRLGVPRLEEIDEAGVLASLPLNPEAARFYALGLAKLRQFDALAAKDLLEQATKSDPKFSLGHAMLARAWNQLGYEQKRKQEAKKALDLSSDLPRLERMQVEGDYYESVADHEKATSIYRAMFELYPDNVECGLQLAAAQHAAGHGSQAAATLAKLRNLPSPASDDPRIDLLDARAGATNDPARLALIQSALRKASQQDKRLVYAQARKEECMNLVYGDHPDQGLPICEDAYNIFLTAGNRLGAADAIRLMGDYEGSRGHLEQAIATYQRALKILQELGEHEKTGAVLNNMAIGFENEGKLDRAEQLYRQAKFHFEQAGDRGNMSTALGNIGDTLFLRGDLPGALKLYQQALDVEATLDLSSPGYLYYRLADLALVQGRVREAHRMAQQAIDALRPNHGGYGYLAEAMMELGDVLKAEGNLEEAHRDFESARDLGQRIGDMALLEESQTGLAELALEEGHADQAEALLRPAIAEFEKEKGDPNATAAYIELSHALLEQGKLVEARETIQHAIELSLTSPDPALKLPAAIQRARVEMAVSGANASASSIATTRLQLRSTVGSAKKLGYYTLECEARLVLGELEMKVSPGSGREQLSGLAVESRSHGLELIARQAEQAVSATGTTLAANKPSR